MEEIAREPAIRIFPNPAKGEINIQINDLSSERLEISLVDVLGRVVLSKQFINTQNELRLSLDDVDNGIFFLQVKSGTFTFHERIIIQK
ncbi:MAG: T9SS type A sorting domain-containing protein [Bacteroidetes bacterium]|nr:T9SS type A sorting domain-containing protein [Bacteroidota bacterium]